MLSSAGSDVERQLAQAEEDARQLELIRQDPPSYFTLPRQLLREGGPFVMVAIVTARDGCGAEVEKTLRTIHEEADALEFDVYSHRMVRGLAEEDRENEFAVIMEFNEPGAALRHFNGDGFGQLMRSNLLAAPPNHTFYRSTD